jgi:hypothetical protein
MAEVGKASTGNKADIAGADHGNAHGRSIMEVANHFRSKPDRGLHSRRNAEWREAAASMHFL